MKGHDKKPLLSWGAALAVGVCSLMSVAQADSLVVGSQNFKPSCTNLQREMREIQQKQFSLKNGDQSVFDLHKKHDALTAELAITEGILNLKADFRAHRQSMFDTPMNEFKDSVAKLDEGILLAGKMMALESFIGELKADPAELQAAIAKLKGDAEADPTSQEVIMELAASKCAASARPSFCDVLARESEQASGLATKVVSLVGGDDKRPIFRTLREFSRTYQVLGASTESERVSVDKLSEFESLLKQGEAFDPALYYQETTDLMNGYQAHSQQLAADIERFRECTSAANASNDATALAACEMTTAETQAQQEALIAQLNEKMSDPALMEKHKVSIGVLASNLALVASKHDAAKRSNRDVAGLDEESNQKYNEVLLRSIEKMSCVHSSLQKRGLKGTPNDYFKNASAPDQNKMLSDIKIVLGRVAPDCKAAVEGASDIEQFKLMGSTLSGCVENLSETNLSAIKNDVEGLRREQQLIKAQIVAAEAGNNYQALEELKTFVAMRFQKGRCLAELSASQETIVACEQAGVDVGFKSIARLTDSTGQIIAEYQHNLIGSVESREGEKEYSQKLLNICRGPNIIAMNLSTCHSVNLYREIVHQPTKLEREQKEISEKNITYNPATRKREVRNRKPVVSDPLVLQAATKNILGFGTAYIQGQNAYNYGMIDANQRLNMSWSNYYLNQYYANNQALLAGTWNTGTYPFSVTTTRFPETSSYFSIQ